MKIGIVQFPGSNCERETMLAVQRAGMQPVEFLWNESHEKLREMNGYVIVGGFSYEDRSRAGIIAALDPVMQEIRAQSKLGKPVLGICNGAQILVETGMVPGLENDKLAMVLTENKRIADGKILGTGFYNAWVHMRLSENYQRNAFTRHLNTKRILHVPVAHGEGRFVMSDALLQEVEAQGLNVFQYCDANGVITDEFPVNPNGSLRNIAAISNKAGNVMAMMPHPERTQNGDAIFASMRDYISEGHREQVEPLYYYPRRKTPVIYQKPEKAFECVVELVITDNHALTVQNTLHQLGVPVTVKRQVHWEIHCEDEMTLQRIKQSGVLFNVRKEVETQAVIGSRVGKAQRAHQVAEMAGASRACPEDITHPTSNTNHVAILVRSKDDIVGGQKQQMLQDHFSIQNMNAIHYGILWRFHGEGDQNTLLDRILNSHIIHNPYAHDDYQYNTQLS